MDILSSIKPWLEVLFGSLTNQDILRKNPWIDKIFLSIGKRIKQFLRWLSVVSDRKYLLEKLQYCLNFFLKPFLVSFLIVGIGCLTNFPSELLQYIICVFLIIFTSMMILALFKATLEFKFKSFSKAYFQFSFFAICSPILLLFIDSQDEKHLFRNLLISSFPFEPNDSMTSMALKILGVGSITLASYYLILCPLVGGSSLIASIFLYATSKLAKVLERMTTSDVKSVALVASFFLYFIQGKCSS
jgi:hypothetical protein